jgi:hypothetical protein
MILSTLLGVWLFTGLIFQGQDMPLPNPNLKIEYHFTENGLNRLFYYREGEQGFCERTARFQFSENTLFQEVLSVNPDNAPWCAQDQDMRAGYKSWSRAWIKNEKFHLAVMMGEEQLVYVWTKNNQ